MSKEPTPAKDFKFLDIASKFILIYLLLKLIIFPIAQTSITIIPSLINKKTILTENIKMPDITFPDIIIMAIILLLQPQTVEIVKKFNFKSFDLSR
ncbi:MAG: hypothetical protein ACKO3K_03105 [Cuspidothrix sp.]